MWEKSVEGGEAERRDAEQRDADKNGPYRMKTRSHVSLFSWQFSYCQSTLSSPQPSTQVCIASSELALPLHTLYCCLLIRAMSGAGGRTERVVHQDYIVRQRYSNTLPPPPGAPKLLDLPLNGMATYTMPVYAERLLKTQPLNIEADAFLGMPIDLVGMPGIFEGDESCSYFLRARDTRYTDMKLAIQAPQVPPAIDSRDRILLRPLKSLGKPKNEVADISFLRRTQYVAEDRSRIEGGGRAATGQIKRRKVDTSKENPMHILRSAIKGFDIANPESAYTGPDNEPNIRGLSATLAETEAWKHPKHPSKPNLKVVDTYPLIPDLSAFTEDQQGGYAVLKFIGNPTEITDKYDQRLDASFLRMLPFDSQELAEYQEKLTAHKANPELYSAPTLPTTKYEFFLPLNETIARGIKRKRDTQDPDKDDDTLYTDTREEGSTEKNCFKLPQIRQYESGVQQNFSEAPYQEVAIALHDPEDDADPLQKAAYFYPIGSKTQLKPRRAGKLRAGLSQRQQVEQEQEEKIDELALWWRDMNEEELEHEAELVEALDTKVEEVAGGT